MDRLAITYPTRTGHRKRCVALLLAATLAASCATTDAQPDEAAAPVARAGSTGSALPDPVEPEPEPGEDGDDGVTDDLGALGGVEVDRNLLDVEVTVPAEFVAGADHDAIRADAHEQGIRDVTFNDDGSVTYTMSRAQHRQMMAELGDEVSDGLGDLPHDYPSIQQVEHDHDFTLITLIVDRNAWDNSLDAFAVLAIAFAVGLYHVFDGTGPDDIQIHVDIVDTDTGDVFDTIMLPDDWD